MVSNSGYELIHEDGYWRGKFKAMASPCELLIETDDKKLALSLTKLAYDEALRIEHKFSRYRENNIIHKINNSNGQAITVDEETALLLDYANQCFQISEGLFDITSGVLREIWKFDGSDNVPKDKDVKRILPHIGWQKVKWNNPIITLQADMEVDLGGIGKEYAVDRTAMLIRAQTDISVLINFGGDLFATNPKTDGSGWIIGIEKSHLTKPVNDAVDFHLKNGGIATSGDLYRFLQKDGVRYSHILNPITGWPVTNAPHTITVVSESCIEAGILATVAMLHGKKSNKFLKDQEIKYWTT